MYEALYSKYFKRTMFCKHLVYQRKLFLCATACNSAKTIISFPGNKLFDIIFFWKSFSLATFSFLVLCSVDLPTTTPFSSLLSFRLHCIPVEVPSRYPLLILFDISLLLESGVFSIVGHVHYTCCII